MQQDQDWEGMQQDQDEVRHLLADLQKHMEPERYAEFVRNLEQGDIDAETVLRSF